MTMLAWQWLLLAAAAPVLLVLAWHARRPLREDVGTLWLWRQAAREVQSATRRSRSLDLLFYLCVAAVLAGALGAARPALTGQAAPPGVAVYVERLSTGETEPGLEEVARRAAEYAPGARLTFFVSADGPTGNWQRLTPGPLEAELAQFGTAGEFSDRLLFLCNPDVPGHVSGRIVPRVTEARAGVVFHAASEGESLLLRATAGPAPEVEGATLQRAEAGSTEQLLEYRPIAAAVRVRDGAGEVVLTRRAFVVGVGDDWTGAQHRALLAALEPDAAGESPPAVWLGARELAPAVRINMGDAADLAGVEVAFDPSHPLFADLPLSAFDWTRAGRLLPESRARRPLITVLRDGEPVGALAGVRGGALEFAGDPFTDSPVAAAALLLDNAIGVVTGERPSQRTRYELEGELPSRRAAGAAPFEPAGELQLEPAADAPRHLDSVLLVLALLATLGAAWLTLKESRAGRVRRRL